jgi:hypothetical protein
MKSLTVGFIFCHSRCSELAPTGFSNSADHDLGVSPPALPALQNTETRQQRRIAEQDIIREFGSTGFGRLVEGIIQQVDVYQRGD